MNADLVPFLLLLLVTAGALVAALVFSPALRHYAQTMLTRREWLAAGQIVALVVMVMVLLYASIGFEFGAEQFIYGRF